MSNVQIEIFKKHLSSCEMIFEEKLSKYGASWLGFSPQGLADQIYIKAHRYKTLTQVSNRKVPDPPELELYALINYSIIFLIYLDDNFINNFCISPRNAFGDLPDHLKDKVLKKYKEEVKENLLLHINKDHDYGSAWKTLSKQGIADLIFAKTLRLKKMLSSDNKSIDVEDPDGIIATLRDICNYALFALCLTEVIS